MGRNDQSGRLATAAGVVVVLVGLLGGLVLAYQGKDIPEFLVAMTTGAMGFLLPSPMSQGAARTQSAPAARPELSGVAGAAAG